MVPRATRAPRGWLVKPCQPQPPGSDSVGAGGARGPALPASSGGRWCCWSRHRLPLAAVQVQTSAQGQRPRAGEGPGPPWAPSGPRAGVGSGGTHARRERLAAAALLAQEGAPLLVESEDVALQVEHGRVGPAAALAGTAAHVPFRGVDLQVLLQVVLALERFLAHFAHDFLWGSRQRTLAGFSRGHPTEGAGTQHTRNPFVPKPFD